MATLPWEWPLLPCPIVAAAIAPRLPRVRARARMPRIMRARADLGDLRCADNLRCAPPVGPLVGVLVHNELRVSIGEGPLIDDMGFGSSKREKLLLCGHRDMTFGPIQASFSAHARASCSDRISPRHSRNTSLRRYRSSLIPLDPPPAAGATRIWLR